MQKDVENMAINFKFRLNHHLNSKQTMVYVKVPRYESQSKVPNTLLNFIHKFRAGGNLHWGPRKINTCASNDGECNWQYKQFSPSGRPTRPCISIKPNPPMSLLASGSPMIQNILLSSVVYNNQTRESMKTLTKQKCKIINASIFQINIQLVWLMQGIQAHL